MRALGTHLALVDAVRPEGEPRTSTNHRPTWDTAYIFSNLALPTSNATSARIAMPKERCATPPKAHDNAAKTHSTTCAYSSRSAYSLAVAKSYSGTSALMRLTSA